MNLKPIISNKSIETPKILDVSINNFKVYFEWSSSHKVVVYRDIYDLTPNPLSGNTFVDVNPLIGIEMIYSIYAVSEIGYSEPSVHRITIYANTSDTSSEN